MSSVSNNSGYSYIATEEELTVELKSIKRDITEAIIHWTETRIDQDLTAENVNSFFTRSNQKMPYHYIIRRNGSLQRGIHREDIQGTLKNGHEKYALQIAFVGGINTADKSLANLTEYKSKNSLTIEQFKTFKTLVRYLYEAKPGIQILGHNDIDKSQLDPGFDVRSYTETEFEKISILQSPDTKGPMTVNDIIQFKRAYNAE